MANMLFLGLMSNGLMSQGGHIVLNQLDTVSAGGFEGNILCWRRYPHGTFDTISTYILKFITHETIINKLF